MSEPKIPSLVSLLAGGLAGTTVDVALFPLDTIKTRLQAPQGFFQAGGFKGIYKGLNSVALGSAPSSALFFTAYDTTRQALTLACERSNGGAAASGSQVYLANMVAASLGEVAACLVRVPTDNVKVRMQSGAVNSMTEAIASLVKTKPLPAPAAAAAPSAAAAAASAAAAATPHIVRGSGLYTGFGVTILRDVPFSILQFPMYEALKRHWHTRRYHALLHSTSSTASKAFSAEAGAGMTASAARAADPLWAAAALSPLHAALCGSVAGGISAAATTPIDVVRTRLMLGRDAAGVPYAGVADCARRVAAEGGAKSLFAGVAPRVMWITIGGSVFFGAVETYRTLLAKSGFV